MHPLRGVRSFAVRHPLAVPIVWVASIQYFVVQAVVAAAWTSPQSWRLDAISDLGATSCGRFDGRPVCSPLHGLTNASLVLLGLSMAMGSALVHQHFRAARTGFALMAAAGIGAILVGLFAEDTTYWAHLAGADLAFLVGGMERVVAYPQTVWLIVIGLYLSARSDRSSVTRVGTPGS